MDVNNMPDAAITIAMTALFASNGKTVLRNIYNWLVKESNRLKVMTYELRKMNVSFSKGKDYLIIKPTNNLVTAKINTYNHHMITISFTLTALSDISVTIINPNCVCKTFPNFFKEFKKLSIF